MVNTVLKKKKESSIERGAVQITEWLGTPLSIGIHTCIFTLAFLSYFLGVSFETVLLVMTTFLSIEAIYLSLFIQLSVNVTKESLEDVEEDIEDIQEDVEGLEGASREMQEDVEGLEGNLRKLRKNMQGLEEDVEDISEDIDRFTLEDDKEAGAQSAHIESSKSLQNVEREIINLSKGIIALRDDLEILKKNLP
jgi:uncharacterized protein YoxC